MTWLSKLSGMMSGAPDTSATLFGPVHIGATSGGGIETAKGPQTAAPSANAAIVASPVNEKSLEPAKPAEATRQSQQRQRQGQGKHARQDADRRCETAPACQEEGPASTS